MNLQPNPGGLKPVVDRRHNDASEREDVLVAIREAFDAASRQIEDIARDMRGQVKEHTAESHGRVAKLLAADECGFIETADGREIYFHRNAVLDGAYRRLRVGSEVRFVEAEGAKGAQASTVRLIGKQASITSYRGSAACGFLSGRAISRAGAPPRTAAITVNR